MMQDSISAGTQAGAAGRALASLRSAEVPGQVQEFLSFQLGGESYCIDILKVQEIRSFSAPTHIAGAPGYIRGVIDLRGSIVPIVDLRLRLGVGVAREDAQTVVIVLSLQRGPVGLVADAVREVLKLSAADIRPAPSFNAGVPAEFIRGLASVPAAQGEELVIVTDIEQLISADVFGLLPA